MLRVQLENPEFLPDILAVPEVKSIYLTSERVEFEKLDQYASACHEAGKECVLALPSVFRLEAKNWFLDRMDLLKRAGLDAVAVRNIDELGFLKAAGWEIPVIGDHSLYSWNRKAEEF